MFHAEYSSGQPLRMLVDLRAAVDDALQNGAHKNPLAAGVPPLPATSGGGNTETRLAALERRDKRPSRQE